MRDFRDAKAMAQTLRDALKAKSIAITHSESLELVARMFGFQDWNVLSARIQAGHPATPLPRPAAALSTAAAIRLPAMPLRDLVLFPQAVSPLFVARAKSKQAVERAMAADRRFFTVTQKRAGADDPGADALYGVGVVVRVIDQVTLPDGNVKLIVQGLERAAVTGIFDGEYLSAEVRPIAEQRTHAAEAHTLARAVLDAYHAHANVNLSTPPQILMRMPHISEPGILADFVAQLLSIGIEQRQAVLEIADVVTRLERVLDLIQPDRQPV